MTRRRVVLFVAVAVAGAAALAERGGAAAGSTFRMPSGNIGCAHFGTTLRCDILTGLRPEPAAACALDWTGLPLGARGRARPTCAGDTAFDRRAPVLRYGTTWRRGGISCASRRSGLRCANRSGRGFDLARERWRTF